METYQLVIVALIGVISPLLLALLNGWISRRQASREAHYRRLERKEDYERQDLVAARTKAVADKAEEAAFLLLETNKETMEMAHTTNRKLDEVHVLVNSSYTEAMAAQLIAMEREYLLTKEIFALRQDQPNKESLKHLADLEEAILKLRATLKERHSQTIIAASNLEEKDRV